MRNAVIARNILREVFDLGTYPAMWTNKYKQYRTVKIYCDRNDRQAIDRVRALVRARIPGGSVNVTRGHRYPWSGDNTRGGLIIRVPLDKFNK